jgi:hypothetical protein
LFHLATVDKNVAAAIFWMKARAGWREKQEIQFGNRPIEQLSDADLERLIARLGEDPEIEGELADVENDTPRQRAR